MQKIHQVTVARSRFRRGNALRPVNRIKHVVDLQYASALGVNTVNTLITAVDNPVLANTAEVQSGSTVNGIYLVVEINATSNTTLSNAYMYIVKNPGGNLTLPAANVVGASDDKRYVIHQEMVMLQQVANSNPRTLFKGVIAIPRGYRRMASGDFLQIMILAPGTNINVCHQCHFKEFR